MTDVDSQKDYYDQIGFSARLGYGERPAVLVIDICHGITERRDSKMFIDMDAHIPRIQKILAAIQGSFGKVLMIARLSVGDDRIGDIRTGNVQQRLIDCDLSPRVDQ